MRDYTVVILTEIQLSGFKSFASKTVLPFENGLTAIIGPNGSGKSNLAEAIRWVLGEQSSKQLRGLVNQDIIFSGSDNTKRAHRAKVVLSFNNESGRFPIVAPEIQISRSLSFDGESMYEINRESVRLMDLQQMLAEAGVGSKGYAVISQGMVDEYLTATPRERRELFDEACGIRPLQIKLAQAQRKLSITDRKAEEVHQTISELEPRKRLLQRQVVRERKRKRLAQEMIESKMCWYHSSWHNLYAQKVKQEEICLLTKSKIKQAVIERETIEKKLLALSERMDYKHKNEKSVSFLAQQLQAAQLEFQQKLKEHTKSVELEIELKDSLKVIQKQIVIVKSRLKIVRQAQDKSHWPDTVRQTLIESLSLFKDIRTGKEVSFDQLDKIIGSITQAEKKVSTDPERTKFIDIEKHVQDLARLKAVEEEKMQLLKALVVPDSPSEIRINELQKALHTLEENTVKQNRRLQNKLTSARKVEIEHERGAGTAIYELERIRSDITELEQNIAREYGQTSLIGVRNTSLLPFVDVPTTAQLQSSERNLLSLGEIDPLALKEYEEVNERFEYLHAQLADVEDAKKQLETLQKSLLRQMQERFNNQFAVIQNAFDKQFKILFSGGVAQLKLIDTGADEDEDVKSSTSEGIEIYVNPPRKKVRHINLLSGGEKSLTSLALLFAILEVQKPPFLVLDEVDAALDETNSARFTKMLMEKSEVTQCLVITHNRETMGQADALFGVTMNKEGISKLYSVRLSDSKERVALPVSVGSAKF